MFELDDKKLDKDDPCKEILAEICFSIWDTFHMTNKQSLGWFVFGHGMIVSIENVANWKVTSQCKQYLIDKNNSE